jgi:hypothetical protein
MMTGPAEGQGGAGNTHTAWHTIVLENINYMYWEMDINL